MIARSASDSRVVSFESQRDWLEWIEDSKAADLRSIRTLVLRLTDVNLSAALLHAPVEQSTSSRPTSNAWELYQKELLKLDKGLSSMPALVHIRIIPPRPNQSQLLRGMYLSFLKLVPRRFPKLQRLELADSNGVLKVVPELNQIAEVYCLQPAPTTPSPPADSTTTSRPPTLKHKVEDGGSKTRARNTRID